MDPQLTVSGFTFRLSSLLLASPFLYKLSRFLNKLFGSFFRIAISRYSSTISFYSTRDDSRLYPNQSLQDKSSYLNIGSGFFSHPKWICIDLPAKTAIYSAIQGKINHDFLPADLNIYSLRTLFIAESFYAVYSSHTLEHLSRSVLKTLFIDFHYILKKNGVFRICVPDLQSLFNVLQIPQLDSNCNKMLFFLKESYTPLYSYVVNLEPSESTNFIEQICTHLRGVSLEEALSYITKLYSSLGLIDTFPPDFHISYPTATFLRKLSVEAGFSYSYVTCRAASASSVFNNKYLFDTTIPDMSLYMEFIK